MKVLILTPWYPSDTDAMSGLFVQKHVEAVRAQGAEVRVIFSQGWRDTWNQWRAIEREGWLPDVVQLNVIQKQGLLALWLKRRFAIPYIIIEHWSGYLPENGQFRQMSSLQKRFYQRIASQAEMILTVSQALQRAMQSNGIKAKSWGTIDNVVDEFFKLSAFSSQHSEKKTLLHVSCFDEKAKNVKGLLRAAKMLSERRQDWSLVLVGTGVDYRDVRAYADALEIPEGLLCWTGELTPQEVANEMHRADALVLSSRYETYGVVLAEAATARLPILSTPVGIAEEVADLIVPQEVAISKPGRFAEFIETILFHQERLDPKPNLCERFTAERIGQHLMDIYDSCLHRDI
ncbi:MAG: glycosyltransferase family 4 protein [Paludibacteraceae bacterium]|nr:glycosyltransferase family 4 protein [Paludibacteraceae bacterium]